MKTMSGRKRSSSSRASTRRSTMATSSPSCFSRGAAVSAVARRDSRKSTRGLRAAMARRAVLLSATAAAAARRLAVFSPLTAARFSFSCGFEPVLKKRLKIPRCTGTGWRVLGAAAAPPPSPRVRDRAPRETPPRAPRQRRESFSISRSESRASASRWRASAASIRGCSSRSNCCCNSARRCSSRCASASSSICFSMTGGRCFNSARSASNARRAASNSAFSAAR